MRMELHAVIHEEDGSYWAEVKELPGCFASGQSLDEVKEALVEAIGPVLDGHEKVHVEELKLSTA